MFEAIRPLDKNVLPESEQLDIIIIGAGLGGLGAAIALRLAGHKVTVLEAASALGEVGAGIQILPNSSRVLIQWGLQDYMEARATYPTKVNILGWKGNAITSMDFGEATREYGAPFWDFHRADLHLGLLARSKELGAMILVNSRVAHIDCSSAEKARVILENGQNLESDMVIGADGLHSRCREILLGKPSPPKATGDLAYRVLLEADAFRDDPELAVFLHPHEVRYWLGPDAHAVNYPLRRGKLLNMVLCVPDDMPADATTLDGNVKEMQAAFKDWDPRIPKVLKYCLSVQKWKLCYHPSFEASWSNSTGTLVLLGDAVHAMLPYLASGAGMSLEDAATLGVCLSKVSKQSSNAERVHALTVYENCRRPRTEAVVERGNLQQTLYHFPNGTQQAERDALFKKYEERSHKDDTDEKDPLAWRRHGVGSWLLSYNVSKDIANNWHKQHKAGRDSVLQP
ncbi:FAD/NAD(P)-binding domain-containing protein [Myriangium duriaei CBS 260.36]|uniref:FAD/NAD(P)-binding domain-containing protein n=1 Tax=Myriangium duriaei CBS 260.36 TaxID=1168546 RepID=A0A9P4J300_9PEZI|nr:FAD/NAD(P)-binding domain-containing protein [Myriangium duriaei CBS 260.36]